MKRPFWFQNEDSSVLFMELFSWSYRGLPQPWWMCLCFNSAASWNRDPALLFPLASSTRALSSNSSGYGTRYHKRLWQRSRRPSQPDPNQYKVMWVDNGLAPFSPQNGQSVLQRSFSVECSRSGDTIHRLCEEGHLDKAVDSLLAMDKLGTVPSVNMYRSLLKSCTKRKALAQAIKVHTHLAQHKLESTMYLGESVVKTLVKCGSLEGALQLFNRLLQRTVVSWTAIISGYVNAGQGQEALKMYQRMLEEGVEPNTYTFISLLKACRSLADLKEGKRVHAEVLKYHCASDMFVQTCLVDMYAQCGSIMDAQTVFEGLSHRDVVSWNSMLTAYVHQREAEKALQLYERMQAESVNADGRTFVSVLQACGMLAETEDVEGGQFSKRKALEKGKTVHADACRNGYQSDVFVGSTLISMYGKCGCIEDAQNVFDSLSQRNAVSWNAILAAYNQHGQPEKTLRLYEQMCTERVSADVRTFIAALQACGMLAENAVEGQAQALVMGKAIHVDIRRNGYSSDVFVGNTLVGMYGKCGSIVEAQYVFDRLTQRNMVSWNVMLAAYVQQGKAYKVLELYDQMHEEGFIPNDRTFVSMLQACGMLAEMDNVILDGASTSVKFLDKGKALHAHAQSKGYVSDMFVGNSLVSMYGKCGSILDAQTAFNSLSHQTVVGWTAMLAAYTQQGQADKAFQVYERMHEEGVSTNDRTFVAVLQACGLLAEVEADVAVNMQSTKVKSLQTGKLIHAEAWRKGYENDTFVANTLISMYGKCATIVDAQDVFDRLSQQNVVSWNVILAAYAALHGEAKKALHVYAQMQEEGVSPNDRTFASALQACGMLAQEEEDVFLDGQSYKAKSLDQVKAIHIAAWRKGYGTDVYIGSILISMYAKCGSIEDSRSVFDLFSHQSLVAWNAMLSAYVEQQQGEKALQLYSNMQEQNRTANVVTFLSILQACSSTGRLDVCRQIHQTLLLTTSDLPLVANTLIHAYGRCSSMTDAQIVFDGMPQPDVVSWTALIAGYARQGSSVASLKCYEDMLLTDVRPNGVTFLSILSACSHAGLVGKGVEYFESMSREYGLCPQIEHYVSMVDLLGRAGFFQRVEHLLSAMPMQPNLLMCLCVLGACQKHGKVELGKQAFECALSLQPRDAAAYVLMMNIYAEAGLLRHAKEINELRQTAGALKKPGQSWIEFEQEVHTFVVGDSGHAQQCQLYILLRSVCSELEEGYLC